MHFGAGPWFAVRETPGDDWQPYGRVWWSDAEHDGLATLEMRATLLAPKTAEDPAGGS